MRFLVLVPAMFLLLCSQLCAEVCVIYTAYNYAGESAQFCGRRETFQSAKDDAKKKARDDGYNVPGSIVSNADTCSDPLCDDAMMMHMRSISPVANLPWQVNVHIACTGPAIDVTIAGRTYAEAFCNAKQEACAMAAERNADPLNPFKCTCRYTTTIIERPCCPTPSQPRVCVPKRCNPQACVPRTRCRVLQ